MSISTIRAATEVDIPRLVRMGQRFRAETTYAKYLSENLDKMAQLGKKLIAENGLILCERNGENVGMLGMVVYDHFISGDRTAGEVFWWAEPEYPGEGIRLLRAAEDLGREAGAKNMQMIAPNERVARLYEHRGYSFVESTYQKAL